LIRQLFHIKQSGSVQEYIDQFIELIDQLIAYESTVDQCYYTTHFVDGLKDEIKSVILVQLPINLDTACSLALLQEEVDVARRREHRRPEPLYRFNSWAAPVPLPLPPPPPKLDKSLDGAAVHEKPSSKSNKLAVHDDKVATLRAYRRARGLY
jgi:hypothetical protein